MSLLPTLLCSLHVRHDVPLVCVAPLDIIVSLCAVSGVTEDNGQPAIKPVNRPVADIVLPCSATGTNGQDPNLRSIFSVTREVRHTRAGFRLAGLCV